MRALLREEFMKPIFAAAVAALVLGLPLAKAQQTAKPALPPQSPAQTDFPGLGEIMSLQQMRHIKLWFAGHAANWPLADYEIGELKEGFEDVTKLTGGDIVDQHVGGPIAALEKAIDGKDRAAFDAAFDQLSAGCNACHYTLDHAFIVIQRPASLPYSDQLFSPPK
jgi:hypothetical protein